MTQREITLKPKDGNGATFPKQINVLVTGEDKNYWYGFAGNYTANINANPLYFPKFAWELQKSQPATVGSSQELNS